MADGYKTSGKFFLENICSECNICEAEEERKISSGMCIMLYEVDPKKFVGRVVRTGCVIQKDNSVIDRKFLRSPLGFMEVFCNPYFCPVMDGKCVNTKTKAICYTTWLYGIDIKREVVDSVISMCNTNDIKLVSGNQLKIDKAWEKLSRKKKRKVNKILKKILAKVGYKYKPVSTSNKKNTKTKKPSTALLYNDDKEWVSHIHNVLEL